MEFIALLIAFALLQYWGTAAKAHRDDWLSQWMNKCQLLTRQPIAMLVLAVFLPSVLLALLLNAGSYVLWGSAELLISVASLLYAFGRGEFKQSLSEYVQAWRSGKLDDLDVKVSRIDADYVADAGHQPHQIHVCARDSIIYAGFQRMFVVLFWFALLGPVAAVFYRLLMLYQQRLEACCIISKSLQKIMEWPAARLLGFSFIFVGDFTKALSTFSSSFMHRGMSDKQFVSVCALAALDLHVQWLVPSFAERYDDKTLAAKAGEEVQMLQQLLNRSLIFAIIGIAIFQVVS